MRTFYGLLFFLAVLIGGCSSARVLNAERAEGVDLQHYKTFDFFQVQAGGDTVSTHFNNLISKTEDAIAIEMQKHGYLLSKTNPDLLINIGLVINDEIQTRETDYLTDAPRYISQRRYTWKSQEVVVSEYKQGTITVDLVDRISNKQVWQGTVQGVIPENERRVEKRLKKGIGKLFSDFR